MNVRDPNRVYKYCNEFASMWASMPDLRFGQLMGILHRKAKTLGHDLFIMEDDEAMEFIRLEMMKMSERYING